RFRIDRKVGRRHSRITGVEVQSQRSQYVERRKLAEFPTACVGDAALLFGDGKGEPHKADLAAMAFDDGDHTLGKARLDRWFWREGEDQRLAGFGGGVEHRHP